MRSSKVESRAVDGILERIAFWASCEWLWLVVDKL